MPITDKKPNPFQNLGEDSALDDFTPREVTTAPTSQQDRAREKAAVTEVAIESGFRINNNEEAPIKASKKAPGPKTFLKTLRIQIPDYNKFQRWCNECGYSQQHGFNLLVKHIPRKGA